MMPRTQGMPRWTGHSQIVLNDSLVQDDDEVRMNTAHRTLFEAPESSYSVPESRVFTYPTRLADTYAPDCLEIVKPAFTVSLPSVRIGVVRTRSSLLPRFRDQTLRRRLYMATAPRLKIDDVHLLDLRYEADINISHLVTFAAPTALLARACLESPFMVVLKEDTSELSKKVFKALGLEYLCTNRDIEGNFVVGSDGHDRSYEGLYSTIFPGHIEVTPTSPVHDRIYISRRDSRRLANEDEVHSVLAKAGFQRVYFEDYPIAQQWAFARHAKVIVALHGAALSSVLFALPGIRLVEIFHPGFTVDFFRRLVHLAGGRWCGVTGKIPPDLVQRLDRNGKTSSYLYASTELHPNTLHRALEWLSIPS